MTALSLRARMALLAAVVALSLAAAGLTVIAVPSRGPAGASADGARGQALALAEVRARPHVVFRSTAQDASYGRLAAVPLDAPSGPRAVTDLECERVHATATRGVCLSADRGVLTRYAATLLDAKLHPQRSWRLGGAPSRTRVAPDGSAVATTAFVTGHSYASAGFSTETVVHDLGAQTPVGDLERFRVLVDGAVLDAPDLNVWGVTFPTAGGARFYATVASGGRTWLAEGDLRRRTLRALFKDVECPSVSPDGRRIAFKQRAPGSAALWHVAVLDLASGRRWRVAEHRLVDDQVEWLDDERLVYGLPRDESAVTDVWVVPVEGGAPSRMIAGAWSPAVVR